MRRFLVFFAIFSPISEAVLNLKPKQYVNSVGLGDRFGGIGTHSDESDHFKLLAADGDSLLVGARNAVYNLSLSSLVVNHKIDWKPPSDSIEECIMKGKSKIECQNYIRVLARKSAGVQLVCGTHAFAPKCREYTTDGAGHVRMTRQFDGLGISPYDPRHNSSALYLPDTKQLYTATVTDFVGNDALIYRKNVDEDSRSSMIRTQRDDIRVLDSPNFVASFAYKEHIYFWFRELASEAVDNNEEAQVYARVARVCKSDKGGARPSNERWTSYLKARLNCSLPSATSPFYFNELKAVSEPIAAGNDHTVYAVFSTPQSEIRMSAICAFSMNRVRDEFENGQFKHQKSAQSIWSPISRNDQPRQRPGRCVGDSTKLPEAAVSFIQRNPLMFRAIQPIGPPLLIEAVERAELTQITVLPRVNAVNSHKYDVLFIGTADGRVLKVVEIDGNATLIQSSQIFARHVAIVNLLTDTNNIVVVSSDEIASLPVHNCAQQTSCSKCVQLQDPHCAWDSQIARCVHRTDWHGGHFIQNMVFGQSEQCPEGIIFGETLEETDGHLLQSEAILTSSSTTIDGSVKQHTTVTLALAVLIASIVSLIFGAFIGARITQWATSSDAHRSASSTSGSDYDSFGRARLTRHDSLTTATKIDHTYAPPSKTSIDATSMILSMNATHPMSMSQHGSGVNTPSRDKNAIVTSINQNTLPRDYKVKKVYL